MTKWECFRGSNFQKGLIHHSLGDEKKKKNIFLLHFILKMCRREGQQRGRCPIALGLLCLFSVCRCNTQVHKSLTAVGPQCPCGILAMFFSLKLHLIFGAEREEKDGALGKAYSTWLSLGHCVQIEKQRSADFYY